LHLIKGFSVKNKILIAFFLLTTFGCQTTGNVNSIAKDAPKFEPLGREVFVFGPTHKKINNFSYDDVCFSLPKRSVYSECAFHKLNYDFYLGKKGYYTKAEPIRYSNYGHVLRQAVLETGWVVYMVSSDKYKHTGNYIIPEEEYNRMVAFKPTPIIQGSNIIVEGYDPRIRGDLFVSSQQIKGEYKRYTYSEKK
jgi:hypothetical protein